MELVDFLKSNTSIPRRMIGLNINTESIKSYDYELLKFTRSVISDSKFWLTGIDICELDSALAWIYYRDF